MSANFPVRTHGIPPRLSQAIDGILRRKYAVSLDESRVLAQAVQRLSDYFIANPGGATPWDERWCQLAYLAYYTPLNAARMSAVFAEGNRFGFFAPDERLLDFGAGLGSTAWAAAEDLPHAQITEWEPHAFARGLALDLRAEGELPARDQTDALPEAGAFSIWSFSYSLIESGKLPKGAQKAAKLVILEPSTREQGRNLMRLRSNLLNQGFHVWAPCTHEQDCPLLKHSEKDWCHDRIRFEAPDWFRALEHHLPVKNPTLTFSYLLLSRAPSPLARAEKSAARLVGDLLPEKGKDRQLLCQNDERVFLTWLHRDWKDREEIPRGALLETPVGVLKGNELRISEVVRALPEGAF